MPHSDDFGLDDDDSALLAVATQIEASQHGGFEASSRPTKRRRVNHGPRQVDGASSDGLEWAESENEVCSLPKRASSNAQAQERTASDDEPEEDPDYYLPGELKGLEDKSVKTSRFKIHVPKDGRQYDDQIFTQTQVRLDSDPGHFRGAVRKRPKPAAPPPPLFGATGRNGASRRPDALNNAAAVSVARQTTLSGTNGFTNAFQRTDRYEDDTRLAADLQAEENSRQPVPQDGHKLRSPLDDRPINELSLELADLPSDAFLSSSPEKEVIELSSQPATSQAPPQRLRGPHQGLKQMTIFGQPATQDLSASQRAQKKHAWPLMSKDEPPTHHKLDEMATETWVYPTNLGTIRDYQYNIVSRSLFHNTLVALPTGLGKTFIAATVMLNYYRWTKDSQIVFMAPTKPLIAQQMEACYHIVGIPRSDTVLMTGETTPAIRAEEWLEKRVFFTTPQTVINDLKTGICDPKRFVLVVVDEAHKATGSYAYTEVVAFLHRFNPSFRIQALTATPGSTVESVQAVIDHLGIARTELRTEMSLDIRAYTHEKHTDTELFDFSDEQALVMDLLSKALRPVLEKLSTQNAYWSRDPMQLTAYGLTLARKKWQASDAGRKATMPIKGMVNSIFTVLASFGHGIGLLKFHGIGPFYSSVLEFQKGVESGQSKGKYAAQIAQSEDFIKMTRTIRGWTNNVDFIGHPKLQYLREVVLNHFLDAGEGNQGPDVPPSATRVMVFASYRDSTEEICRVLKRSEPMIRPHVFVGQAASKDSEGMNQKRQNAVIQDFKAGKYNTLIATSIGEEGLDIGDVDLIVNYDASASPIRMLQRIGRTGRKRAGKIVLLLMKGKEENDYSKAQDNYAYIQKTIGDASKYNYRDDQSPRILPKGVQPVVDKRIIEIPIENTQPVELNERARKGKGKGKAKRPPKKFHMPDNVRTGFVEASRLGFDDEDESEIETAPKKKASAKKKALPFQHRRRSIEPELEPVQLPLLEDVLLNGVQRRELDRKYAYTADDENNDLTIKPPNIGRFPDRLRALGVMKYVRHGRTSEIVATSLQALHDVDTRQVAKMKDMASGVNNLLTDAGPAKVRLVSPVTDVSDDGLPDNPLVAAKAKRASRAPSKKKQPLKCVTSFRSIATNETEDSNATSVATKPRGRPRKKQSVRRAASYGSAAAEGDESSPEPTPANMRIGTQGIDLGSADTSGEEEDEEPESELAEFVVRSDQPVEMADSSQRLPDDTQPLRPKAQRGRLKQAATKISNLLSDVESDGTAMSVGDEPVEDHDSSEVEEVSAPSAAAGLKARRRRIVGGSDSDE